MKFMKTLSSSRDILVSCGTDSILLCWKQRKSPKINNNPHYFTSKRFFQSTISTEFSAIHLLKTSELTIKS